MKCKPLKWHGGKHYLSKQIIEMMPSHTHYVETHFGSGDVLFRKKFEGISETANDINFELTNFWKVLQDENLFNMFMRKVEVLPLSEVEFNESVIKKDSVHDVHKALSFFVRYRQSRQGLGKDYCTPTKRTRRGMNENVSAWLTAIEGLPQAHFRLKRVEIRCMDANKLIPLYDHENCLFYCDPPYLPETRVSKVAFENEMTHDEHKELLETLSNISGKFILSGYRSSLYEEYRKKNSWNCKVIKIDNKASNKKKKEIKEECLWYNYG